MRVNRTTAAVLALFIAASAACVRPPSDVRLGSSKRAAELRQTQNPGAGEQRERAPEGMGATTAADVLTNYHENQRVEAQERRQDRQRDRGISEIGRGN